MATAKNKYSKELEVIKNSGGTINTSVAIKQGIHPRDLYAMRDSGIIEQINRGIYRIAKLPPLSYPDIETVALKVPKGVICLISALAFHNITTQVPHEVHIAVKRNSYKPHIVYPPCRYYEFSEPVFNSGVEEHILDNIPVKIYSTEKTVADCFVFRNKIGLDIAIEALRLCRTRKRSTATLIMKYAKICRVETVMKPYLEAIL